MNGKVIEERSMNYTSYKDYVRIPFLFQGQYYDEEIKLAYNRFRYYDPQMGRYILYVGYAFQRGLLYQKSWQRCSEHEHHKQDKSDYHSTA